MIRWTPVCFTHSVFVDVQTDQTSEKLELMAGLRPMCFRDSSFIMNLSKSNKIDVIPPSNIPFTFLMKYARKITLLFLN